MRYKAVLFPLPAVILFATILMMAASCPAQVQTVLLRFNARSDGSGPRGGLIVDSVGNLYGATTWGGDGQTDICRNGKFGGCGTVFELSPPAPGSGKWTETVLHVFLNTDGFYPTGNLVMDAAGNLYGTTAYGGTNGRGNVYQLSPPVVPGDPWTANTIYSFQFSPLDGQNPYAGLVIDGAGNLYGTTTYGGACNEGTVFELSPPATQGAPWTEQVIHDFHWYCNGSYSSDGAVPQSSLVLGKNGQLYGTTGNGGGQFGHGIVFRLSPPSRGQTTWSSLVLYTFNGGPDGQYPLANLSYYGGSLYGTTSTGGDVACNFDQTGCGVVFQLSPAGPGQPWTFNTIYSFTGAGDGQNPYAGVIVDKNGALYGTTDGGGSLNCDDNYSHGCGVVYQLTPPVNLGDPWTQSTLYAFSGDVDGRNSVAPLVIGKNGALYGTTFAGGNMQCTDYGSSGCGVVFKLIP